MWYKAKRKREGFTLIELLVVISIIAVLMSILMPALGKVREQAKSTICRSRLRSLIQAVSTYESTIGKLPMNGYVTVDGKSVDMRWFSLVAPYVNRQDNNSDASAKNKNTASAYELFKCPTQDYLTKLFQNWDGVSKLISPETGNELHGTGTGQGIYGYNIYFRQDRLPNSGCNYNKTSQAKQSSALPMIADLDAEDATYAPKNEVTGFQMGVSYPHPNAYKYGWKPNNPRSPTNNDRYGPAANHKTDKINYAFADGHVSAMDNLWPWYDKSDYTTSRKNYFHPLKNAK